MTLTQCFLRSAQSHGAKAFVRMKRGGAVHAMQYAEAFSAAQQLAARLVEEGYEPGERVLLYGENQPEWVVAYFGCVAAGLTVVPLDPQTPPQEVRALGRFTDARLLLASDAALEGISPYLGDEADDGWRAIRLAQIAHTGGKGETSCSPPTPPLGPVIDRAHPGLPASIIFTAGTTVEPKGAVLSHRNFLANASGVSSLLEPFCDDEFLSILPLTHAFEFTNGLLIPLWAGATVTYVGSMNPRKILEAMHEVHATVMLGMPRVYRMFLDIAQRRTQNTGRPFAVELRALFGDRVRVLVSGGAALDPDVYCAFLEAGVPVHEGYGLTESAPVLTVNPAVQTRRGSVGKALPTVELRVDSSGPDGIGEIIARGPNIMQGYFRNTAATEKVLRDGWLHTGDVGYLDEDGYLYITGRIKDVIVTSAGKNVYPDEVELLYKGLPHVRDICVVGLQDEQRREEVHGVLVLPPAVLADESLRHEVQLALQDVAARIPSYQRIQHVHYWSRELPRTHSHTVKREEVRALLAAERADQEEATEIRIASSPQDWGQGSWQQEVVAEIGRIAGVDSRAIRPGDHFDQDLNLDSLMKVELLAMLETNYHIAVPDHIALKFQAVQDVLDFLAPHMEAMPHAGAAANGRRVSLEALPSKERDTRYLYKSAIQSVLAAIFRWGARIFYRLAFGLTGRGLDALPKEGPVIIAANHSSHLDSGAILSLLAKRADRLHVLGAKDYFFNSSLKGWIVSTFLNVLPFDRHGDFVRSLGLSQRAVQMGRSLLIFPEGTRSRTGEIQPFKPGLGLLALELGVPVVPAYIDGAFRALPKGQIFPRGSHIRVAFGPPISVEPYRDRRAREPRYPLYKEITGRVQQTVEKLRQSILASS
jgi:long-chain acyl-CoA synthetase